MRAIVIDKFGGAENLKLREVENPIAGEGEILIQVSHAGVNPVDWKIREGYLSSLFRHRFPLILGWDVAGYVAAIGPGVNSFQVGDRVFAYGRKPCVHAGTYAELVTIPAAMVAHTPVGVSEAQAAAVPLAALTAWQGIYDFAGLEAKQTILIHAGAGGVGSFAIQLAKLRGAKVVTTATKSKNSYVSNLGADLVIDYSKENFFEKTKKWCPEGVDVVFDSVGGETLKKSFDVVKRGGTLVSIVETPDLALAENSGIRSGFIFVEPNDQQLQKIGELIASKKIKLPEITIMPLEQAAEAHLKSQTQRTLGKIVLKI